MSDVINIDGYRPHVNIRTHDDNVHVIPVAFFESLVKGRISIDSLDDHEKIIRVIVGEWLVRHLASSGESILEVDGK